jgi:hypothetical protein
MRCKECASLKSNVLYQIHPGRLALAFVISIAVNCLGAYIFQYLSFFVIFASYYYGNLIGEMFLRLTGRKAGKPVEIASVTSIALGAIIVYGYEFISQIADDKADALQQHASYSVLTSLDAYISMSIWHLIGIVIACVMCYRYVR